MKIMKKRLLSTTVGLVALLLIGSAASAPFNDSKSDATGNDDVVTKKVAREQSDSLKVKVDHKKVPKVDVAKTQASQSNDQPHFSDYMSKVLSISSSKVQSAAKNQQQAATLIQSEVGLNADQSQKAAEVIFTDSDYSGLRNDLSSGNWLGAYGDYQQLSNNGSITKLQQEIGK